eukprot:c13759_g1_i2.p1 GENE.c13759_g1_i2~~c13759_g1_i2.p1  ORF type:complete len:125 (-),score=26.14 c13759_g1_i2:86-460(-)
MFHPRADLKTTSQLVVKTCQTLGLTKKPLARQTPVSKLIRKGLDKLGISDSIIQNECEEVARSLQTSQPNRKVPSIVGASLFLVLHKPSNASRLDIRPSLHSVSKACGDTPISITNVLNILTVC